MVESVQNAPTYRTEVIDGTQFVPSIQPAARYETPSNIVQTHTIGERTLRIILPELSRQVQYRVFDSHFPTHVDSFHLGHITALDPHNVQILKRHRSSNLVVEICRTQGDTSTFEQILIGRDQQRIFIVNTSNIYKQSTLYAPLSPLEIERELSQQKSGKKTLSHIGTFHPNQQRIIQQDTIYRRFPTPLEREKLPSTTFEALFDQAITTEPTDLQSIATAFLIQLKNDNPPNVAQLRDLLASNTAPTTQTIHLPELPVGQSNFEIREIQGMNCLCTDGTEILTCRVGIREQEAFFIFNLQEMSYGEPRLIPVLPSDYSAHAVLLAQLTNEQHEITTQVAFEFIGREWKKPAHSLVLSLKEIKQMILKGKLTDARIIAAIGLAEHHLEKEQRIPLGKSPYSPTSPPMPPEINPGNYPR